MNGEEQRRWGTASPLASEDKAEGRFESSVNALWFGLMATSVLIFIFLLIAIFERFMFIRPSPSSASDPSIPPFASPKIGREISVLMPGEEVPTFIAQPCPPSSSNKP